METEFVCLAKNFASSGIPKLNLFVEHMKWWTSEEKQKFPEHSKLHVKIHKTQIQSVDIKNNVRLFFVFLAVWCSRVGPPEILSYKNAERVVSNVLWWIY